MPTRSLNQYFPLFGGPELGSQGGAGGGAGGLAPYMPQPATPIFLDTFSTNFNVQEHIADVRLPCVDACNVFNPSLYNVTNTTMFISGGEVYSATPAEADTGVMDIDYLTHRWEAVVRPLESGTRLYLARARNSEGLSLRFEWLFRDDGQLIMTSYGLSDTIATTDAGAYGPGYYTLTLSRNGAGATTMSVAELPAEVPGGVIPTNAYSYSFAVRNVAMTELRLFGSN